MEINLNNRRRLFRLRPELRRITAPFTARPHTSHSTTCFGSQFAELEIASQRIFSFH
jgi:hypothetical protein